MFGDILGGGCPGGNPRCRRIAWRAVPSTCAPRGRALGCRARRAEGRGRVAAVPREARRGHDRGAAPQVGAALPGVRGGGPLVRRLERGEAEVPLPGVRHEVRPADGHHLREREAAAAQDHAHRRGHVPQRVAAPHRADLRGQPLDRLPLAPQGVLNGQRLAGPRGLIRARVDRRDVLRGHARRARAGGAQEEGALQGQGVRGGGGSTRSSRRWPS